MTERLAFMSKGLQSRMREGPEDSAQVPHGQELELAVPSQSTTDRGAELPEPCSRQQLQFAHTIFFTINTLPYFLDFHRQCNSEHRMLAPLVHVYAYSWATF